MTRADRPHGMTRYRRGPDEHGTPGKGCRCTTCRAVANGRDRHRRRMIAYGRWDELADATGTRRRLQALMRCGYSLGLLSARLGCTRQELRVKLHERSRVKAATARAIRVLYDDLWDQPPPERTAYERRSVRMARRYATERGWVLPAAWDDDQIDDPAASPAVGWERSGRRERGTLAAEVAELTGFGLDLTEAAERLGVSRSTLTTTLNRARAEEAEDAAA